MGHRVSRPGAWLLLILSTAFAMSSGCRRGAQTSLDLATTTSMQNAGLLDVLLPAYLEAAQVSVRVHAAGSGRALQMLADDMVDIVISHAPAAEAAALRQQPGWVRRDLAFNRFVIVGPPTDPADVGSATDAVDAFRRVARSGQPFVSRGDLSGTHERENALWDEAGERPPPERMIVSGRGMSLALRHADELSGYTLSDEATFAQHSADLNLALLFAGDPALLNRYVVIYPADAPGASAFADWLVTGAGRGLIGQFRVAGKPVFQVPTGR